MPRFKVYRMPDPFIGFGCKLPDTGMFMSIPAVSINLELLFIGFALEWRV